MKSTTNFVRIAGTNKSITGEIDVFEDHYLQKSTIQTRNNVYTPFP